MFRMNWNDIRQQPGISQVYTRFGARPAWVWGIAFLLGLLPALIIIALLFLTGLLITAIVYFVLSTIHKIITLITGSTTPRNTIVDEPPFDGRQNVRVISPHHGE